jgi:tripartite-type tricarboxylate transporter receptor subunit TctC
MRKAAERARVPKHEGENTMVNVFAKTSRVSCSLSRFVAALAFVSISATAMAQEYPNKLIRVIIPYAAGGALDVTARIVAERLETLLKQTVIIENKPGAAGKIAADFVSRSDPDGYTLLYTATADLAILQTRPSTTDSLRNLVPIAAAVSPVEVIATRPGLGLDSIEQLLAFIKANPGKLTYGSTGYGSSQHLLGESLKQIGYEMLHVPFNGMGPMVQALDGGHIDVGITNLATSLPLAGDGRIKILAVTQSEPFEDTPDIPSLKRALPEFTVRKAIFAYYGPPGLPQPIISKLSADINKVLVMAEVKARLKPLAIVPVVTSPQEFATMVQDTAKSYEGIIKAAGIKLE